MSPIIAPRAISQAMNAAPSRLAMIASIISQIAGPTRWTNLEDAAANMPMITIAMPQKKAPKDSNGEKMKKKMPIMPPMPTKIKSMLPISARMKPMLAKVREICFTS